MPSVYRSTMVGWMYEARHTAGVLRRVSLTIAAASLTPDRASRSLPGAGMPASNDAAWHVACHVRKSLAVTSICDAAAQVVVHIVRLHRTAPAVVVDILEEQGTGQFVALVDDPDDAPVGEIDLVRLPALAAEHEPNARGRRLGVTVAQCRQPVRVVRLGVLLVAHSHQRALEQPHDRRQHTFTREIRRLEIALDLPPDAGQRRAELCELAELDAVAKRTPLRVIAILLPAARVPARGLEVAAGRRADPDVGPRGRDGEGAHAFEHRGVVHRGTVGVEDPERPSGAAPAEPGLLVGDVSKIGNRHERHVGPVYPQAGGLKRLARGGRIGDSTR